MPARFVLFSMVGASGVVVHFSLLWLTHRLGGLEFVPAQSLATLVAMTSNYAINNVLTYRDSRRRGVKFFTGLLSFILVCSVGAVANVGIAGVVFNSNYSWWLAGAAGVLIGTVWNYVASSIFTWKRR